MPPKPLFQPPWLEPHVRAPWQLDPSMGDSYLLHKAEIDAAMEAYEAKVCVLCNQQLVQAATAGHLHRTTVTC